MAKKGTVKRINIAIAGGPCTGKSTLAAALFAYLKTHDLDYDLIFEESRKLKGEMGRYRIPFERFYIWRQQEREERRSNAANGFITDCPLVQLYVGARQYAKTKRDMIPVRELFRMCLEIEDRYQLVVIAKNPNEIGYKTDGSRITPENRARERHELTRSFVEHFWPNKLLFVEGSLEKRLKQVVKKLDEMGRFS